MGWIKISIPCTTVYVGWLYLRLISITLSWHICMLLRYSMPFFYWKKCVLLKRKHSVIHVIFVFVLSGSPVGFVHPCRFPLASLLPWLTIKYSLYAVGACCQKRENTFFYNVSWSPLFLTNVRSISNSCKWAKYLSDSFLLGLRPMKIWTIGCVTISLFISDILPKPAGSQNILSLNSSVLQIKRLILTYLDQDRKKKNNDPFTRIWRNYYVKWITPEDSNYSLY